MKGARSRGNGDGEERGQGAVATPVRTPATPHPPARPPQPETGFSWKLLPGGALSDGKCRAGADSDT